MEKCLILSNVVKYMQHSQYAIGHYELETKTLEEM